MAKRIKVKNSLFNKDTARNLIDDLKEKLSFPYIGARISTLGGRDNPVILLTVSADPKESWINGILENNKYRRFSIYNDGTVENFIASDMTKIRKFTAKSVEDIATRLDKY